MDLQPTANVVLIAPEIPQNTGNIIRLCANVGARLHLVEPIGFKLGNPGLRRASLDYSDLTDIVIHNSVDEFFQTISIDNVYGATIPGTVPYTVPRYQREDTIIFGSESVGLPRSVVDRLNLEHWEILLSQQQLGQEELHLMQLLGQFLWLLLRQQN